MAVRFQVFGLPQILVYERPVILPLTGTHDEHNWAYREGGLWINVTSVLKAAGQPRIILLVPGAANPDRLRFGNPNNAWPNAGGGQLREFNVPIPFGTLPALLQNALPASTLWLPRRV